MYYFYKKGIHGHYKISNGIDEYIPILSPKDYHYTLVKILPYAHIHTNICTKMGFEVL